MPVIYTIVVTYNGKKWLSNTLEALQRSSMSTRVLVVDNASTDGTVELVGQFENIELICLDSNLGFGAANNIGIRKAMENGAEFVFLLNQDAYVFEDTIEKLVTELKKAVFVGVLSPLQLAPGGKQLDRAFSGYLKRAAKKMTTEQWVTNLGNDAIRHLVPIRFVNAAAWMMRMDCIQKTGLFHPAFYHYGEDNNYAARLQYHGYHLAILPGAAIIHDRLQEPADPAKEWKRKLQTIPLYTLLDIRKLSWLAHWLGRRKMNRLISRKPAGGDATDEQLINSMKAWFNERSGEVRKIRATMKKEGCGF